MKNPTVLFAVLVMVTGGASCGSGGGSSSPATPTFFGGIKQQIDPTTGALLSSNPTVYSLAYRPNVHAGRRHPASRWQLRYL